MDRIFNSDNAFFRTLSKFVDCVVISACWVICNVPLAIVISLCVMTGTVLIYPLAFAAMLLSGPATCGLYYCVVKNVRNNHGYAWKEFWHGFANCFKQGTLAGLVIFGLGTLFVVDTYILYKIVYESSFGPFCFVFIVLLFVVIMWATYIFAYIARFENTMKEVFRNTLIVMLANLPKSFVQAVFLLVVGYVSYLFWPGITSIFMFLVPALYMLIKSFPLEKTFRKYMSEEDLANEDENNRDYKN